MPTIPIPRFNDLVDKDGNLDNEGLQTRLTKLGRSLEYIMSHMDSENVQRLQNRAEQTLVSSTGYGVNLITADNLVTVTDDRSTNLVYNPAAQAASSSNPWYQIYGSMYFYDKTFTAADGALVSSPASTQTVSYTFIGDKVSIIGGVFADSGKINVYLDGDLKATVDTYAPFAGADKWNIGRAELYNIENLVYGKHTIKVQATTEKNASSVGYKFWFDGFRVGRGMNAKQTDEMVADQVAYIPTNGDGYGALNVGGYEPGGSTGEWVMRCITGARLYGAPDPTTNSANKPKVGAKGQNLFIWDGPASSTGVQIEYSVLLVRK